MTVAEMPSTNLGNQYHVPKTMKAWVLGGPEELALVEKRVPEPGPAEVLVRIERGRHLRDRPGDHPPRPAGIHRG
jgi:hypothetical protein